MSIHGTKSVSIKRSAELNAPRHVFSPTEMNSKINDLIKSGKVRKK